MNQGSPAFGDGGAFRAIFFEEAQEHLAGTEAILLRLDTAAPSSDDLNAIFRAVHSIKGSAAMLGFNEIASLTHVLENLLDLLRKGERAIDAADVDAMLAAGDIVKSQVAHHLGQLSEAPDGSSIAALLRERVTLPGAGGATGPVTRGFAVRLGPLDAPIDAPDLDMMLSGLAEMGTLRNQAIDNMPGGLVSFEVTLEGTEMDLRSVLALVVAPERIHVQAQEDAPEVAPAQPVAAANGAAPAKAWTGAREEGNEIFIDPAEFRRSKASRADGAQSPPPGAGAATAPEGVELFVTPESLNGRKPASPGVPAPAARGADAPRSGAYNTGSIRVATEKIDLLVNLVGELVITESMLSREGALTEQNARSGGSGLADLARHTRDLQEMVLAIRMVPISDVFGRLPRLVRELSARLGKRVELTTSGEATELDRGLIEKIVDPLTHLVRNAVDHGLETPDARIAAGKRPIGTVSLAATQRGGKVVIEVSDDGRGLDRAVIIAHAAQRGRHVPADASDAEVWQLLFEAGFSTAAQVTDVSGRGVGMDVVRRNILAMGGSVEVVSRKGQGVKVTMTVPLTLAIVEAMTVSLGEQIYVLPLDQVLESRSLDAGEIHSLPGQRETISVRGEYLPVLRLATLFPPQQARPQADAIAVLVEAEGGSAAVLVDTLVGQQQVVVKSLETNFRKVPGVSGATIMSDGSVALILDVAHLIRSCGATQLVPSDGHVAQSSGA